MIKEPIQPPKIVTKAVSHNPISDFNTFIKNQNTKWYRKQRWYETKSKDALRPKSPVVKITGIHIRSESKPVELKCRKK